VGGFAQGLLVAIWGLTLSDSSLWAQSVDPAQRGVSIRERFSGPVRSELGGGSQEVRYYVLSLAPEVRAAAPKPMGPVAKQAITLYELRAGKLETIIDGQRQDRREGEFWVVGPEQEISFESGDDSVIVQVIQVSDP
jgi:hypothetical protein